MLDGVPFKPIPTMNVLCHYGGLGDSVARMPAVNYLLSQHPHIQHVDLYVQDYFIPVARELLKHHGERITVHGYTGMKEKINASDAPGMKCDNVHHTTLRTHLTDHAFHCIVDAGNIPKEEKVYLKFKWAGNITRKDQVVITTGFTSATREFNPLVINEIAQWCISMGFKVIFLGKSQSEFWEEKGKATTANFRPEVDYSVGEDLRDKTSLMTAANIMARSRAVIGLDNGLLHLAACTYTPVIMGFTTVNPKHRVPYGGYVLEVQPDLFKVPCRFCQSKMGFVYNFDLRNCYTNTYKCVSEQTAAPYIRHLEEVLGGYFLQRTATR